MLMGVFFTVIRLGIMLLTVEVMFQFTDNIASWSKGELYLLMFLFRLIQKICYVVFDHNISCLSDHVVDGTLDGFIIKPMNTLVLVAFSDLSFEDFIRMFVDVVSLGLVIVWFGISSTPLAIICTTIATLCGIIAMFASKLFFNTLTFWFDRIDNINLIFYSAGSFGRFPIDVLPRAIRPILFSIIPLAFVSYLPASILPGKFPPTYTVFAIAGSVILLTLSLLFFDVALKRYSSASS